ncbi:MAG: N-acetylglucosamine-6-phosphate deacetylase [Firmicutes bacterium]|nr:N-acetylglucosamine-6-phosphate deacetylase [Bacillota bacterium]
MRTKILVADTLFTPEEVPGPAAVVLNGPKIAAVWPVADAEAAAERVRNELGHNQADVVDLRPLRLAPGFIDLHIHGFGGYDASTGNMNALQGLAEQLIPTGVTGFVPALVAGDREATIHQIRRWAGLAEGGMPVNAAQVVGIRLEGPFLNPGRRGAQPAEHLRAPDVGELDDWMTVDRGWLRIVDYAPELDPEGRFLEALLKYKLRPSAGHTLASYEDLHQAIDRGLSHCAHLFNGMAGFHHREPGAVGALLTDRRVTVELIADGVHVHPAALKLAVMARGPEAIALVTDAVAGAGMPDGTYVLGEQEIIVHEGIARLPDGTLAGSTLTLDRAVRNLVALTGVGWADAIRMVTLTPAKIAGMWGRKGQLARGMDADLVALDAEGHVQQVWVRGQVAYRREG